MSSFYRWNMNETNNGSSLLEDLIQMALELYLNRSMRQSVIVINNLNLEPDLSCLNHSSAIYLLSISPWIPPLENY